MTCFLWPQLNFNALVNHLQPLYGEIVRVRIDGWNISGMDSAGLKSGEEGSSNKCHPQKQSVEVMSIFRPSSGILIFIWKLPFEII